MKKSHVFVLVLAVILIVGYFVAIRPMAEKRAAKIEAMTQMAVMDYTQSVEIYRGVVMKDRSISRIGNNVTVFVRNPQKDAMYSFFGIPVVLLADDEAAREFLKTGDTSLFFDKEIYFYGQSPVAGNPSRPLIIGSVQQFNTALGKQVSQFEVDNVFGGRVVNPKK